MTVGFLATALLALARFPAAAPQLNPMIDPAIDDPAGEWCFLAKTTTVIGVPFQPDVTQVTFDGALFTRSAELCFFYGPKRKPMFARQRTFLDGWIPVVGFAWQDGTIRYEWEAFAAELENEGPENTVNFVRLRMRNTGTSMANAEVTAGVRHSGQDYRFGPGPFDRLWRYEMTAKSAMRDGKLVYAFPTGARRESVAGEAYVSPFVGKDKGVGQATAVCLASYEGRLAPGETWELTFTMPRVPTADKGFLAKLARTSYSRARAQTVRFWKDAVLKGAVFEIPESRVQDAQRASLVHMMLATRTRDGKRFQSDGLPYPNLFLSSNMQAQMSYDSQGRMKDYEVNWPEIAARQNPDGIFMDTSLPQNGQPLIAAHGQTLHALCYHYVLTRDADYGRRILPAIVRAVDWLRREREKDPYGLMPASWPYDAEMILGHYTSHNLWCLLGLRSAIRMARGLGETALAQRWSALHDEYERSIQKALDASAAPDGYIPTGLYKFATGNAARQGFREYQTNQDWENVLLTAPTEALPPGDPRVGGTVARFRKTKFREGVMTYRNGQHLHQYITANVLEQDMARGWQRQAMTDLYHMLLHNGPTHEGFENLVEPWTRQVWADCPPPHAWAAMKLSLLIRNALIVERGGRAGLDEGRRDLHLFSLMSPEWAVSGKSVGFKNAPCEMGRLTASLRFTGTGAALSLRSAFVSPPHRIVVHVPYFVELRNFRTDAREATVVDLPGSPPDIGKAISLSPDATRLTMVWTARPRAHDHTLQELLLNYRREPDFRVENGEGVVTPGGPGFLSPSEESLPPTPLSFATVLRAYRMEYARRYAEYVRQGGKAVQVAPREL